MPSQQTRYMSPRSTRYENPEPYGSIRGGKLAPVCAHSFQPSEAGVVEQSIQMALKPLTGRLMSTIYARVRAVYVPVLGVEALMNADADYPGSADILRARMVAGEEIFPLENETEISRMMGITPMSYSGVKKVLSAPRIAANVAINFLRRQAYREAAQVAHDNSSITPAIVKHSIMQLFNGVLDPEDRVNGSAQLRGSVAVKGLAINNFGTADNSYIANLTDGGTRESGTTVPDDQIDPYTGWKVKSTGGTGAAELIVLQHPTDPNVPDIRVDFGTGTDGSGMALTDFFQAERMDDLTRYLRAMYDRDPLHGEDNIGNVVHGMEVETGKDPFVLYDRTVPLYNGIKEATDGDNLDFEKTYAVGEVGFTVPVPKNEFGGFVITFLEITPEEIVANQPHPVMSKPWATKNHVADELAIDPVPMTMRQLDSEVSAADEGNTAFFIGNNHEERIWSSRGFHRGIDTSMLDHEMALWHYALPLSVDPEAILYPEDLDHTPFGITDPTANVCDYGVVSNAMISTPTILGPTPIEELALLEADQLDVFEGE